MIRRLAICMGILFLGTVSGYQASRFNEPTWQPPAKTTIVMHCIDGRYHLPQHFKALPPGNFYVTCAGCAKCFVEDEATRESFFHQIELLYSEGITVEEIDFVDHTTCKAYGVHDSLEDHEHFLHEAARLIHQDERSKNLAVHLAIHDMQSNRVIKIPDDDV